jgi:hypothetical protein
MMKLAGAAVLPLCLAMLLAREAGAQQVTDSQSSHSQDTAQPRPASKNPVLTNADVVKMVKGGLQESTILSVIGAAECDFDVSVDGLLALKSAGISDRVMDAMLAAAARKRTLRPPRL